MENEHKNIFITLWKEKRIVSIAFFIAFTQFQNGFDSAAVSGFQAIPGFLAVFGYVDPTNPIGYNLSTKVQTLIQSLMQLGGLISCLFIFKFGFSLSRRLGIWIASLLSLISISIQIGTTNTGAMFFGRVLLGMSNGFFSTYGIIYMSEVAPTYIRGPIIGMVSFQGSLGALIGILIDNYTEVDNGRISYQLPLATMYIVPAILGFGLIFLPDTPRYYVSIDQPSLASSSIRTLRGIKDETQLNSLVSEIEKGWQAEMELNFTTHLKDIFKGNDLRRTCISAGCAIAQTASGMIFLSSFSVYFFVQARIGSPFVWVMIALSIALTGNMLSFPAARFLNRRFLLISSSLINSALMFAMAIVYTVSVVGSPSAGKGLVSLSILFTWIYCLAQGPILWALETEIPSQRLRSQTVGLSQSLNYVVSWLCSYCTPYFINPAWLDWGPKYCYVWGGSNLILAIWVFLFVPETRGRSLEDLDVLFETRVAARRFSSYIFEGTGDEEVYGAEKVSSGKKEEEVSVEKIG